VVALCPFCTVTNSETFNILLWWGDRPPFFIGQLIKSRHIFVTPNVIPAVRLTLRYSNPVPTTIKIYDTFVNCSWVATRWQQYSTHLHTNSTQNDTKRFWKSAGRAPSLRVISWHLPYN
jgi:hypothetical protein